jgi:hypothetical protein
MVVNDAGEDAKYEVETSRSNDALMGRSLSTPSTRHFDNIDSANDTDSVVVNKENDDFKNYRNDAERSLSVTTSRSTFPTIDIKSNVDSSIVGYGVDDVILYPAGGAFNKLRKKQHYLESILKSHWYGYSQTSTNLKKEYVITNILTPMYNSGRQFKIYNPNHRQTGEAEYTIPNVDVAFERMAQKLRDMKKAQTAEVYHCVSNAKSEKGTKRKQQSPAKGNATAAGTATTPPPRKKRKSKKDATSMVVDEQVDALVSATKVKKKGTPRPKKKTVASKCKKKAAVLPKPRKRSTTLVVGTRARLQRTPVASKSPAQQNTTELETSIDQDNDHVEKNEVVLLRDNYEKETVVTISISQMKPTQLISSTSSLISNGSQERNHSNSAFTKRSADSTNSKKNKKNNELLFYNNNNNNTNMMDGTVAPMGVDDMKKYIIRVPLPKAMQHRPGAATDQNHKSSTDQPYDDDDDDDEYGINTAGTGLNDPTISWSSTIDDRNKPSRSTNCHPNRDENVNSTTAGAGSANAVSGSCKDDLSLTELKEIIWSQWEQIDCWRRLCRQYKETYHIQREVILQQDKLLSSSSSKSTNIGGISNNHLLSIPRLLFKKSNASNSYSVSTVPPPHNNPCVDSTTSGNDVAMVDHPTNDPAEIAGTRVMENVENIETSITICEV